MVRVLTVFVAFVVCCGAAFGDDSRDLAQDWIKYFKGEWKGESKIWTEGGGWEEGSGEWSGELVSGGLTLVTRGKGQWGDSSSTMGIEGYTGDFFEYGSAANGNRWRIVFDAIEKDRLRGVLRGGLHDGRKGEGTYEIKRVDAKTYTVSWSFRLPDGDEMKGSGTNTRK